MVGQDVLRKITSLPRYHFLHYDVENEAYAVHVLRLGRAVTEKEAEAEKIEGEEVKRGRIEEAKGEEVEEGEQVSDKRGTPAEHPDEANIGK